MPKLAFKRHDMEFRIIVLEADESGSLTNVPNILAVRLCLYIYSSVNVLRNPPNDGCFTCLFVLSLLPFFPLCSRDRMAVG